VRSLAVDPSARSMGVGTRLVDELRTRARREGYDTLCAFTHAPGYFMPMGFSIVPHLWVTEKVYTDCVKCPKFRQCSQYAMVLPLESALDATERDGQFVARHA
jgi:amino-acid N-acetyltransferase